MTERKFTDEEVIKALECCSKDNVKDCDACPYEDMETKTYCVNELIKDALDIINRQKSEIDILVRKHDSLLDELAEKQAEIERLQEIVNPKCERCVSKTIASAKSEAIKEFDKKFKRASDLICTGSSGSGAADIKNYYRISFDSYEKLIQEMTEKASHDE